jgi:HAD superfamily hydrolase (TIGR01509 family)
MPAVIFDLDGTLLDVREGFYWQFQELTREFDGVPISKGMITAVAHGTTDDILRRVVSNREVPFEDIRRRHAELRTEAYGRYLKLYEGVDELLPILKHMGFTVAALTSSNALPVSHLNRLGIQGHFDAVVTAEHGRHAEGMYLLLERIQRTPAETTMVGDSVTDMLTGKNAGVKKTVGVSHGFGNIEALRVAGADHIIKDIPALLDVLE